MFRQLLILILLPMFLGFSFVQSDYQLERTKMVQKQLIPRGIQDASTLAAMKKVPRHKFVPEGQIPYAYADGALAIGEGQTISQPFIVAYMTQALKLNKNTKVLEIGTGSGYQAAVLAEITDAVYSIEIVPELGSRARRVLEDLGYSKINLKIGDGYNGWEEHAPFDAIIVTAGAEEIPQPLVDQLAVGGRMIIPVGPHRGIRQLVQIDKTTSKIKKKNLLSVRFVPLTRENKNR
ncbi:MAG: protein-L-isoaspartate(D-aspartate) O-methyltransferase [Eudoraea sp.]|nr:protein-L-isoaspartate(D-aspartate) O-methyltransferase [Eudoraea sp.]